MPTTTDRERFDFLRDEVLKKLLEASDALKSERVKHMGISNHYFELDSLIEKVYLDLKHYQRTI